MAIFNTEQSLSYYTKWRVNNLRQIFVKNNISTDCNSLATPCSLQFDYYPNVNDAIYPYGIYANFRADSFPFTVAYDIKSNTKKIISVTDTFFNNDDLSQIASNHIETNSIISTSYSTSVYYNINYQNSFAVYKTTPNSSSVVASKYGIDRSYSSFNKDYALNINYASFSTIRPINDIISLSVIPTSTDISTRFLFIDDLDRLFQGNKQIAQDIPSLRFKKFIAFFKESSFSTGNKIYNGALCESGIYSFTGNYTEQFAGSNPSFLSFDNPNTKAEDYFIFEDQVGTIYLVILFDNNTFRVYSYISTSNVLKPFLRRQNIEVWLADNYGSSFNYSNFLNDYCYYDPFRQKYVTHKKLINGVTGQLDPNKKEMLIPITKASYGGVRLLRSFSIPGGDADEYFGLSSIQSSHQYTLTNFNLNRHPETFVSNSNYNIDKYPQIGQIIDRNFVQTFTIPKPHIFSDTYNETAFIENHKNSRNVASDIENANFDQYISQFTADIEPGPVETNIKILYQFAENVQQISGGWNIEKINVDFYLNNKYLGSHKTSKILNSSISINGKTSETVFKTRSPLDTISNKLEMKIALFYTKDPDSVSASDYVSSLGKTKIINTSSILDLPPEKLAFVGRPTVVSSTISNFSYPYYYENIVVFETTILNKNSQQFNIQYFLDNLKLDTQNANTEITNKTFTTLGSFGSSTSTRYRVTLTVKSGHKYGEVPGRTSISYPVSLRSPIDYQTFNVLYTIPTRPLPDITYLVNSFCTFNINTITSSALGWSGNLSCIANQQLWDSGIESIKASISWVPEISQPTATKDIVIQLSPPNINLNIFSLNFSTESSPVNRQWQAVIRINSMKLRDSGSDVQIPNFIKTLQNATVPAQSDTVIPIDHPGSSFGSSNTVIFNTGTSGPGLPNDRAIYPSNYPRRLPNFPTSVKLPISEPMTYSLSTFGASFLPSLMTSRINTLSVVCPPSSLIASSDQIFLNTNFKIQTGYYPIKNYQGYFSKLNFGVGFVSTPASPAPLVLGKPNSGFVLQDFPVDTSNIKKIIHQNNAVFVLSKNGVLLCLGAVESAVTTYLQNDLMSNVTARDFSNILNKTISLSYLDTKDNQEIELKNGFKFSGSSILRIGTNAVAGYTRYLDTSNQNKIRQFLSELLIDQNFDDECVPFSKDVLYNYVTDNGAFDLNTSVTNNNQWIPIVLEKSTTSHKQWLGDWGTYNMPLRNKGEGPESNTVYCNFDIANIEDFWIENQRVVVKTAQGYFSGSLAKHIHSSGYFLSIARGRSSQQTINDVTSLTATEIKYESHTLTTTGSTINPDENTVGATVYLSSRRNNSQKIPLTVSITKVSSLLNVVIKHFDNVYMPLIGGALSPPPIPATQSFNFTLPSELSDKRIASYIEIVPSSSQNVYNFQALKNKVSPAKLTHLGAKYDTITTQFEELSYDLYVFFHISDGVPLVKIKVCTIQCVFSLSNPPFTYTMSSDISNSIMPLRLIETHGVIAFAADTATLSTSGVINCQAKRYDTFTAFARYTVLSQGYLSGGEAFEYRNFLTENPLGPYSIVLTGNGAIDIRSIVRELTNQRYNIKAIKFRNNIWFSDVTFDRFDLIDRPNRYTYGVPNGSIINNLWINNRLINMSTLTSTQFLDIISGNQNISPTLQTQSGPLLENAKNNLKDLQIIFDKDFFATGGSVLQPIIVSRSTNGDIQRSDVYQSVYDKPFFIAKLQNGSVVKKILQHFIVASATDITNNIKSDTIRPAPFINRQYNTPGGDPLPKIQGTTSYSSSNGIFAIDNYIVQSTDPSNINSIKQSGKITSSTISNPINDRSTITIRHNIPTIVGRILSLSYEVWSSAVNRWVSYDNIRSSSAATTTLTINPQSISGNNLKIRILPKYTKIDNIFDVVYGDYLTVDKPVNLISSEDFNET